MSFGMDAVMREIARAHGAWASACARAVDPRMICHLVRVTHLGSPDEEIVLRGVIVGTWRHHRDGLVTHYRGDVFPR